MSIALGIGNALGWATKAGSGAQQSPLYSDLLAYYSFDGLAGDHLVDSHGNGKTLTAYGSPPSVAGKVSTARNTKTSTGQYFRAWPPHGLDLPGSFTITMWMYVITKPVGTAKYHLAFESWSGSAGYQCVIAFNDAIAFIIYQQPGVAEVIHANVGIGKWVFIGMVHDIDTKYVRAYSSNSGSLVLDDSSQYTFTYNDADDNAGLYVGSGRNTPNSEVNFDAFAIFNKALDFDELDWVYNTGDGRAYADYTG